MGVAEEETNIFMGDNKIRIVVNFDSSFWDRPAVQAEIFVSLAWPTSTMTFAVFLSEESGGHDR